MKKKTAPNKESKPKSEKTKVISFRVPLACVDLSRIMIADYVAKYKANKAKIEIYKNRV
jgi:hypothetical protein